MKRTKQAIGIFLSAAMMLAMLAGCGGKPSTSQGGRDNSSGAASGSNSPSRGNVMMTFGTGDTGGSLYPAGAALSQLWTNSVQGVKCNTQTSTGSFQNVQDVASGEVDVAVATATWC